MSETLKIIKKINNSKALSQQEKEVYSTIAEEWDDIVKFIKKGKESGKLRTIGDNRKGLYEKFGVAPAILFSFSDLFIELSLKKYIDMIWREREEDEKH